METDRSTNWPVTESGMISCPGATVEHTRGCDQALTLETNEAANCVGFSPSNVIDHNLHTYAEKTEVQSNRNLPFFSLIDNKLMNDHSDGVANGLHVYNSSLSEDEEKSCDSYSSGSNIEQMCLTDGDGSNRQNQTGCDDQLSLKCGSDGSMIPDESTHTAGTHGSLGTPGTAGTLGRSTSDPLELTVSAYATRRSTRSRKRSHAAEDMVICPNCGLSIKTSELSNHLQTEIYKLQKFTKRRSYDPARKVPPSTCSTSQNNQESSEEVMDPQTRYKQYLSVRTRRERRVRATKKPRCPGSEETTCPVCNEVISGTEEELAEHVDECLITQEADGEAELDIEGEDTYEEYTWAGQTRIRATTLMDGGPAAAGLTVSRHSAGDEDDNIDLDIDGDDCCLYGTAQYTEADLLPCAEEETQEENERKALRKAVIRAEGARLTKNPPSDRQRWQQGSKLSDDKRVQKDCADDRASTSQTEVLESLKAKIKEQETQLQKIERPKCLICMDWYTKPLTSVQCWHVHCEECWLRTLGTKKLCPQCNMITSPVDLRRIYL